jgi:ParB family transcriptional regulator, chromosome partitioning protein
MAKNKIVRSIETNNTFDEVIETPVVKRPLKFVTANPDDTIVDLDVNLIDPNPEQPRTMFDEEELRELGHSIRKHGQLQPITVCASETAPGRYTLLLGERRWRASKLVNLSTIRAVIRQPMTRGELAELALIENIQRVDLNDMEKAMACQRLMEINGYTQAQLAESLHVNQSSISRLLKLLTLPDVVQEAVSQNKLEPSKALKMAGMQEEDAAVLVEKAATMTREEVKVWADKEKERRSKPASTLAAATSEKRALASILAEPVETELAPEDEIFLDAVVAKGSRSMTIMHEPQPLPEVMHGAYSMNRDELLAAVRGFDFALMDDLRLAMVVQAIQEVERELDSSPTWDSGEDGA